MKVLWIVIVFPVLKSKTTIKSNKESQLNVLNFTIPLVLNRD